MAAKVQLPPLTLEGRSLLFRNFAGKKDRFNAEGSRNFSVVLTEDEGQAMNADGWNVKFHEPREEGDLTIATLKINVKYGGSGRPPRVVLITSRGKTPLDESMVETIDWADIVEADMMIRAWHYDINGSQGIAAYLTSLYVTIREDELEMKYMDVPDAGNYEPSEPDDEGPG